MQEWPQALHMRDLHAAALIIEAKRVAWLAHQMPCWVAGKMTAAPPVTDTDVAFPLKAQARRSKEALRRGLRAKAIAEGVKAKFRCGPYEILRVAYEGHMYVKEKNATEDLILRACRRNYLMSKRPSLSQQRLLRCDEQAWCADMPEGSHRIMSSWATGRYSWVDPKDVPLDAEWDKCGKGVEVVEDMEDATTHGPEGSKVGLRSWAQRKDLKDGVEEPALAIEADEEDLGGAEANATFLGVKLRRRKQLTDTLLSKQGADPKRKAKRHLEKQKIRLALAEVGEQWREFQHGQMEFHSRFQLVEAFIPHAGGGPKAPPSTLNPQPPTLHLDPHPLTLNPKSLSRNPQPSTLNPKP